MRPDREPRSLPMSTPANSRPGLSVTSVTGKASELGRPDGQGPWWATATAEVTGTSGNPVAGAWVTVEVRSDGHTLKHFGLTRRDGTVDFGISVLWSNDATVTVSTVRHLELPYYPDLSTAHEVRIQRPRRNP